MAILRGSLSVVQAVHPREREQFGVRSDASPIDFAACFERLDIIKWTHATYGLPSTHCSGWASGHAAANGYLEVLKWIHASYAEWDPSSALAQAAEHDNYDIMDRMDEEHVGAGASSAMATVAEEGEFRFHALELLHKRYPDHQISIEALRVLAASRQRSVATRLIAEFPERYAQHSAVLTETIETQDAAEKMAPPVVGCCCHH